MNSFLSAEETFRTLAPFWPHFGLHKRACDYSGKSIVSVYDPQCPYPVWNREDWLLHADPPSTDVTLDKPFFDMLWELFCRSPIAHNIGHGNENCAYADDWWYSRNCYMCHSGLNCEDCHYCFRVVEHTRCQFSVYSFRCEISSDLVNCKNCYNVHYGLHSRNCRDSSFLFDCRGCSNCMFCWNLRDQDYCLFNEKLTKDEYQERIRKIDTATVRGYLKAVERFSRMVSRNAFYRGVDLEQCDACTGAYILQSKNCVDSAFASESEDCVRVLRCHKAKDCTDCVSVLGSELCRRSVTTQDSCFEISHCINVVKCRFMEYCAHCYDCEHCFGCCGLVGKKYHVLNRQYSQEDYERLVSLLKKKIRGEGIEDQFFPPKFAANLYEESLAAVHFPLSEEEQKSLGYRVVKTERVRPQHARSALELGAPREHDASILKEVFWDESAKRPYRIDGFDLKFAQECSTVLPHTYYARRLKELYKFMPYSGSLRAVQCPDTNQSIATNLPEGFVKEILSEEAYSKRLY